MLPWYATIHKPLRKNQLIAPLPALGLERPISFYIICPQQMRMDEKMVVDYLVAQMAKLRAE